MMDQETRSPREIAEKMYKRARISLLVMILLTVLNALLVIGQGGSMWIFSPVIPFWSIIIGGMLYAVLIGIGVAVLIMLVYLLCWIMSKKRYGWMIVALVMFIVDTIVKVWTYSQMMPNSAGLDGIIHLWALLSLVIGVYYGAKLKKMPPEEPVPEACESEIHEQEAPTALPEE